MVCHQDLNAHSDPTPFLTRLHPNGWVSLYGQINGGTYFFTDLFLQSLSATTAQVRWDFTTNPDGYFLNLQPCSDTP
jgi:hypothetical protein